MNRFWIILVVFLAACSARPCAYIAVGEKVCLASLPAQPTFATRNEMVMASSAQGPLMAVAQTEWSAQRYSSAVTTAFGQRLYVLHYDGQRIAFEQSDLPLPLRAENVLLDTQLMWWPIALLQTQLPSAARVIEFDENGVRVRELWWKDKKRVRIVFGHDDNGSVIQFEQLGLNYQLLIKELSDD